MLYGMDTDLELQPQLLSLAAARALFRLFGLGASPSAAGS
jgi:hypothetical protein